MKQILLARRYAKALFELAILEKTSDAVHADMEIIAAVMDENRELRRVMSNPLITPSKKLSIMQHLFGKHISALSLKFFAVLIRKGREQQIPEIALQYQMLYLEHNNIAVAELVTAYPADESIKNTIAALVKQGSDKKLLFRTSTNPGIIGGFKLKINDYLLDATISNIIAKLHKEFDKNLYIKRF